MRQKTLRFSLILIIWSHLVMIGLAKLLLLRGSLACGIWELMVVKHLNEIIDFAICVRRWSLVLSSIKALLLCLCAKQMLILRLLLAGLLLLLRLVIWTAERNSLGDGGIVRFKLGAVFDVSLGTFWACKLNWNWLGDAYIDVSICVGCHSRLFVDSWAWDASSVRRSSSVLSARPWPCT